jgi:hypothetical protein
MRKGWTQGEVERIGKLLGLKNFDRRSIDYWVKAGVFPEPVVSVDRLISFYDDELVEVGFVDIGRRMRVPIKITYEDVKWAKEKVLEDVRSKNISLMLEWAKKKKEV